MSLSEEWKKELNTNTSTSQKWKSEITGKTQTPQTHAGIAQQAHNTMEMQRNNMINQNMVINAPKNNVLSNAVNTVGQPIINSLSISVPGVRTFKTIKDFTPLLYKDGQLTDTGRVINRGVAETLDATVDTVEGAKNAFKYQMREDEMKASNQIINREKQLDDLMKKYNSMESKTLTQEEINKIKAGQADENTLKKMQNLNKPTLNLPNYTATKNVIGGTINYDVDANLRNKMIQEKGIEAIPLIEKMIALQGEIDYLKKQYNINDAQEKKEEIYKFAFKPNAIEQFTEDYSKYSQEELSKASPTAQYFGNAVGTVGRMVPSIASNAVLPGTGLVPMGLNVYQSSFEQAMEEGATPEQAIGYGLGSAVIETGTEMASGGLSNKLSGIPGLAKVGNLTKGVKSKVVRGLLNAGGEIATEGLEEVASEVLQPYIKRATYQPEAENATAQELWFAFRDSILPTILMQSGGYAAQSQSVNTYFNKQIKEVNDSNLSDTEKTQLINELKAQKKVALQEILTGEESTQETTPEQPTPQVQQNVQSSQNNIQNVAENQAKIEKIKSNKNSNWHLNFNEQVDRFVDGTLKTGDILYLGDTPRLYQKLGYNVNPMTLMQSELKTMMTPTNDNTAHEHNLTPEMVKRLPEAIAHPLNILKSSSPNTPNSIVIVTDLSDSWDRPIIVSMEMDSKGQIGNIDFLANEVTSAYGKRQYDDFMKREIANGNLLYDIDDGIIKKELPATGLQSPKGISSTSTNNSTLIDNSIPQNTENINNNLENSKQSPISMPENNLQTKYPNINLNENISQMDGIPAIELEDGSILPITTNDTHVEFIRKNGLDVNDIKSGGWIGNGMYEPDYRSDTSKYVEQQKAKQRVAEKRTSRKQIAENQPSNIFEETNQMIENNRNQQLEESSKALALEKETPKVSTPVEEKKIKSLVDIANMTEEDIKQEKGVTYKHKADKNTPYQRKFFENMESSKIISQDVKDRVDMTSYERKANEATLERVNQKLDENGDKMIKEWERKTKNFTDEDVALGAILIQRYQQQGDIESAVDVVQKLADMGTEAGRAVQMFSIFQRLTPEAMMVYQQRKLDAVFDNIKQKKTGEWVEKNKEKFKLTEEDAKFIQEQVEKAQNAETERQKQIELAKIEKRINEKLPPEAGQSIKALRRIAMLFNPKTQVRNIVGNTLIKPVNMVADFIGTQIDKAIAKKTGVRTTNYTNLKSEAEGFKKGIKESIEDYKLGIRTEPTGSKYEFEIGGKPFNENTKSEVVNAVNRKLNGINNLLSAVMSGGDRPFYEAAFNNSLQGQMKANNVDVPTSDMIDIATNEALQRTWNDNNSYTQAVLGIRSAMNKLNIKGFGLGDLIIPFAKTPANLTKAMVEYSPVGYIESLIDYNDMRKAISRGEMTPQQQKKFVSSTSKAIAGTILYAIAGSLVKSGRVTGSKDKDKDVANFEQNVLGIQPYSIKLGDKTYTYSWANPLNFPLAVMADTYKMSKENAKLSEILYNGFKVAGDTLLDNSFLQGIKELFEADSLADGIVDAVADMPNQFVPTFMKQLADLADDTKRQSFEYNDLQQTTINKAKAKIPGLKNELAPQVNTFGEEIKNYGGDNNPFNIFLNPVNISKSNATESQKALYDLYQETKDKTIFPRQAPYYVSNKGEKINLSSQDRAEYQKISGEYVTRELDALFDSEFYKTLSNDQKVDVVNKIVSDADTKGKDKWVDSESTEKLAKLEKDLDGIPMVDYYNAWIAQKGIESDKNYQGKTITNSKSKKQKAAVDKATPDLTKKQREILYDMFSIGKSVW